MALCSRVVNVSDGTVVDNGTSIPRTHADRWLDLYQSNYSVVNGETVYLPYSGLGVFFNDRSEPIALKTVVDLQAQFGLQRGDTVVVDIDVADALLDHACGDELERWLRENVRVMVYDRRKDALVKVGDFGGAN